jgi:hypothetical protein
MHKTTFLKRSAVFLLLGIAASNVWSFAGGGGAPRVTCQEPKFKNIKPPKLIAPGGEFSFTTSSDANPGSIEVVIKGKKIDVDVTDDYGLQVKGKLPAELTEGYVLIKIRATSRQGPCIAEDAWLVKIVEQAE